MLEFMLRGVALDISGLWIQPWPWYTLDRRARELSGLETQETETIYST